MQVAWLSLAILTFLCTNVRAYTNLRSETRPFKNFVVTPNNDSVPFDPYDYYGLRTALNATANSTAVFKPNETQAYLLICNSTRIYFGNATINGSAVLQNSPECLQYANQTVSNSTRYAPLSRILNPVSDISSHPWRDGCVTACQQNGHDGDWCFEMCDLQARIDNGRAGNPDPVLVSACTQLKNNKYAGILTTEVAQIYYRLKNNIDDNGSSCRSTVTILQAYDWQVPVRQAQSSCLSGTKPSGVTFDYNQCVLIDSAGPLYTIRYFDGPSIPDTVAAVHAIAKYPTIVLDFVGALVGVPAAYYTILNYNESLLRDALTTMRALFWWAGVAHDFCYHNGLQGHYFNKNACDRAFYQDCLKMCSATDQQPLLATACSDWAHLFYWLLQFQIDAFVPFVGQVTISFTKGAWEASNYGYAYSLIDVVQAYVHEHDPPAPTPTPPPTPSTAVHTLVAMQLRIFVRGDDKDPDTYGTINVQLSDGETIALFEIRKGHWDDPSTQTFFTNVGRTYTAAQMQSLTANVAMDYITQGHDTMKFDLELTLGFDTVGNVNHCLRGQQAGGCGSSCFLFSCPTNKCPFSSTPPLMIGVNGGLC